MTYVMESPLPEAHCADEVQHKERERYNGWTNRETWAWALHVDNDEGLQYDALLHLSRAYSVHYEGDAECLGVLRFCGEALREWWEELLEHFAQEQMLGIAWRMVKDIGSDWRIDWTEIATCWLADNADAKAIREAYEKPCDECDSAARKKCEAWCTALDGKVNA